MGGQGRGCRGGARGAPPAQGHAPPSCRPMDMLPLRSAQGRCSSLAPRRGGHALPCVREPDMAPICPFPARRTAHAPWSVPGRKVGMRSRDLSRRTKFGHVHQLVRRRQRCPAQRNGPALLCPRPTDIVPTCPTPAPWTGHVPTGGRATLDMSGVSAPKMGMSMIKTRSGGRVPQGTGRRIEVSLQNKTVTYLTDLSYFESADVAGPR